MSNFNLNKSKDGEESSDQNSIRANSPKLCSYHCLNKTKSMQIRINNNINDLEFDDVSNKFSS
ncbi:hypothetical protein BpHYR1_012364 [Brachionus plicatilis]|uniref:Uncharacterized protein n=1 Tax=Brachionus plicatilis TaxID=10195 RepID=A0A3M7S1H0_BRAPC|nr:hypothetical protein BpHYR1_012364 [Brachionus plicatilis]